MDKGGNHRHTKFSSKIVCIFGEILAKASVASVYSERAQGHAEQRALDQRLFCQLKFIYFNTLLALSLSFDKALCKSNF